MKNLKTILSAQATADLDLQIKSELELADPTEQEANSLLGAIDDKSSEGDD